ncbi:opioid growth factor receptor-related protein [Microvirga sp. GCM10011540]|uniref:opioid growth factor receptor-related protein n=1 Tax=Microvirga sp. GCM10011540 TaxID=3317338 RepID=UPI0036122785
MNVDRKSGPLHAYLAGSGTDGRNRTVEDILALPDEALERIHDYIQWLFPLPTRSMAQPNAPVLSEEEIAAIRADEQALANLRRGAARMRRFYEATDDWLTWSDHNHLRITRIIQSLKLLAGDAEARAFHDAVMARHEAAGSPVDPHNLGYWTRALSG